MGLPLTRFGAEKNDFIKYLTKNKRVDFKYENEPYHIEVDDVAVFPQCYAAVVDKIPTMATKAVLAPMKTVKHTLLSMELHLDASIDKLDNLVMDVHMDKEKRVENENTKAQEKRQIRKILKSSSL